MNRKRLISLLLISSIMAYFIMPVTHAAELDTILNETFSGEIDTSKWKTEKNPETSKEYNHSGSSSQSFYIPGGVYGGSGQYIMYSFGARKTTVELYFYDTLSETSNSSFGVAVSASLIFGLYGSQSGYSVYTGSVWRETGAARSEGWHKLVFDTLNQSELIIYLDDVNVWSGSGEINQIKIGNLWETNGWDEWYVDDITVTAEYQESVVDLINSNKVSDEIIQKLLDVNGGADTYNKLPACDHTEIINLIEEGKPYANDNEVNEAYKNALTSVTQYDSDIYDLVLAEDFAEGIDKETWTITGNPQVRSGGEDVFGGGAYAYDLSIDGSENKCLVTSGSSLNRYGSIAYPLDKGKYRIQVYFYDNLKNNPGAYSIKVSDSYIIGIYGDESKYVNTVNGSRTTVGVQRSEGWHKLVFDSITDDVLTVYLDGTKVYSSAEVSIETLEIGTLYSFASFSWFSTDNVTVVRKFAPIVSDVKITDNITAITANYTYSHEKDTPEGDTKFQWYKKNSEGEFEAIEGAASKTYQYQFPEDMGGEFKVEITPVDANGIEGGTVSSEVFKESYIASVMPVVKTVTISGNAYVGSTLTAQYTADNAGGSGAGSDKYIWYISTDGINYTQLDNQQSQTYTLGTEAIGCYIKFAVSVAGKDASYSEWKESEPIKDETNKVQMIAAVKKLSDIGKNKIMLELLQKMDSFFAGYSTSLQQKIVSELLAQDVNSESDYNSIVKSVLTSNQSETAEGGASSSKTNAIAEADSRTINGVAASAPISVDKYSKFKDIDNVQWAIEAIETLADMKIVSGRDENSFCPDDYVTRAEFVTMIIRAFYKIDNTAKPGYDDVDEDAWYAPYIATARKNNIVYGKDNGDFGVDDPITREEMAVICARIVDAGLCDKEDIREYSGFADENTISEYAYDSIVKMYEKGIMNGLGDNMFGAKNNTTRAMAAQMIYTMIKEPDSEQSIRNNAVGTSVIEDFENGLGIFTAGHPTDSTMGKLTTSTAMSYSGGCSLEIKGRGTAYTSVDGNTVFRTMIYDDTLKSGMSSLLIVMGSQAYMVGHTSSAAGPSKTTYVYRVGSAWYDSGIERSTGWHEFMIDFSVSGSVSFIIDGETIKTVSTSENALEYAILGNLWDDSGSTATYADGFIMATSRSAVSTANGEVSITGNKLINSTKPVLDDVSAGLKNAAGLLNALEIMPADDNGDMHFSEQVTRGEMAYYLVGMSNESADYDTADIQIFADVEKDYQYAGYINRAYEKGLISASEGGNFSPESPVTIVEFARGLLKLLGYSALESQLGSDDSAWLSQAGKSGILDNLSIGDGLTKENAARMMFNALSADMYLLESVQNNAPIYSNSDGVQLMHYYFDVYYTVDYINGIYGSELYGKISLMQNQFMLGSLQAVNYKYDLKEYNGIQVKAYIYNAGEDAEEPYVLVYIADTGKSSSIIVEAEDIDAVSNGTFKYYKNRKKSSAKLSSDLKVIYNNSYMFGYTEENLKPEIGYVKLVDADGNGSYELAFVMDYKLLYVKNNDTTSGVIYDRYTDQSVDVSRVDIVTSNITIPDSFNGISTDNFILLAVSDDGNRADIIRCINTVDGTITSISQNEISIDGVPYGRLSLIDEYFDRNGSNKFALGRSGRFFIDPFGNIAGVLDSVQSGEGFGYLINSWYDDSGENVFVKMYTENEKFETIKCKTKLKIDDENGNPQSIVGKTPQLVKYKLSGGEISSISFADTDHQGSEDYKETDKFWLYRTATQWHRIGYGFGKYMNVTSNTKVMLVPDSEHLNNESSFAIRDISYFTEGLTVTYQAYNADKFNVPEIVVVVGSAYHPDEITGKTVMFVADSISEGVDENDDVCEYINGYENGIEKSYKIESGVDIDALKISKGYENGVQKGDALLFYFNSDGEVYDIGQVVYAEESQLAYTNLSTWDMVIDKLSCCYAIIDDQGTGLRLTDGENYCVIKNPTNISVVYRKTGKVFAGTTNDLISGRDVAVRTVNGVTTEVVVYVD